MADTIDLMAIYVGIIVTSIFCLLTLGSIIVGAAAWRKEWLGRQHEQDSTPIRAVRQVSFSGIADRFAQR